MKKEIYEKFFKYVPMRSFYVPLLVHYGQSEDVSNGDKMIAKDMIELLYETSEKDSEHCSLDNPLMDVPFLVKFFVNNYKKPRIFSEIMNNPNFDVTCLLVMLAYAEKYPEHFFARGWDLGYDLIAHKLLPEDKLRRYATSGDKDIRKAVAHNLSCPEDVFELLSKDRIIEVIQTVARNPNTPKRILEDLARHSNLLVKKAVAFNRSASADALRTLAASTNHYEVIRGVVTNNNCPADVLEYFANYVHRSDNERTFMIRLSVATNPNLRKRAWDILWSNPDPMYKNVALASKICPIKKLRELDWKAKYANMVVSRILNREDLPEDLIMDFLTNCGAGIRAVVIREAELSQDILVKCSKDKSKKVRYEVVQKLHDTEALLRILGSLEKTEYETRYNAIKALRSGSADMIINEAKKEPDSSYWKQVALAFVGNDEVSEEEMWKVFHAFKNLEYHGHDCLLADELIARVTKRRLTLSEESLERCIDIILESDFFTNKEKALHELVYCKTFYTSMLLSMCWSELTSEASTKLK